MADGTVLAYGGAGDTVSAPATPSGGGITAWGGAFGSILQLMASLQQGRAARAEAERSKATSDLSAWQAEQQAGLTRAAAQRHALEEERIGRLLTSRILAVAAASGGGANDPTIINLVANQTAINAYKSSVALYDGESKARQLELTGVSQRLSGAQSLEVGAERQLGYGLAAAGAGAKGAMTLYARYGYEGPKGRNEQLDV